MHDSLRTEGDIGDIDIRFTSKPGKGRVLLNFFKGSSSNRQGGERIARMVFIEAKSVSETQLHQPQSS